MAGTSKAHRKKMLPSTNSTTTSGVLGGGGDGSGNCKEVGLPSKKTMLPSLKNDKKYITLQN